MDRGRVFFNALTASVLSGVAVAGVVLLLSDQLELLFGASLPSLRLKQAALHADFSALCVGCVASIFAGAAMILRNQRHDLTVPIEPAGPRFLRAHLWLMLAFAPLVFAGVVPSQIGFAYFAAPWCTVMALAGWFSGLWTLALPGNPPMSPRRIWAVIVWTALVFAGVWGSLAVMQYHALHVPHGDAGMYEEHLWNFLHGKGFRSQLDDGRLFLGEHVEIIHLLLAPIYWLRQELPTLLVCQAIGLSLGAVAIFGLSRTLQLPARTGVCLAVAYLCYGPMQSLLLESTWKIYRPENFGVPLLLFAFWALESKRLWSAAALFFLAFLAKEEYAIVLAGAGAVLIGRRKYGWGTGFLVAGVFLLWLALQVVIPYFRQGAPPHYSAYFRSLGDSPTAIASHLMREPSLLWAKFFRLEAFGLCMQLLAPLAFLPLLSPIRLLPALPIFGYLAIADPRMLQETQFHFHAPLVGVLPWAASGGLANLARWGWNVNRAARFALSAAVFSGVVFGRGPLSYRFYDSMFGVPKSAAPTGVQIPHLFKPEGSYWRDVYLPNQRSAAYRIAQTYIRPEDRVAATDYIRARLTHCRAAHDYPTFRGHVTIDDVDVFVLDRTEGYWGRDRRTNPDHQLLDALESQAPAGAKINVRGRTFVVAYHDDYFLVLRGIR